MGIRHIRKFGSPLFFCLLGAVLNTLFPDWNWGLFAALVLVGLVLAGTYVVEWWGTLKQRYEEAQQRQKEQEAELEDLKGKNQALHILAHAFKDMLEWEQERKR